MPHIALPEGLPGMSAGLDFRPETAKPLGELAQILMQGPSTLTRGERELIATYVSSQNDCYFCQSSHGAIAAACLNDDGELAEQDTEALVIQVKQDFQHAGISETLKALLVIAGQVQEGGKHVTARAVDNARQCGATDLEIHDTVLIAALFCLCNRYVDGLATWQPHDDEMYRQRGQRVAREGYINASKKYLPQETTV